MELDHYEHPTAEKLQEEGERQRLCCALQRGPGNGILDYDHKVFLLSGQAGRQPASSCSCSSPGRAGSLWRPPGQDGVLICAQPTFGQGEQMGGGSLPVLIVRPFFIPPLLCLPSPPLYCILRDLLGVFQRWNPERWGNPLWRKANSLYLASFFLSCRAQQFMASSTALKKWTRPETMILSVQSWKTLLQLYHP